MRFISTYSFQYAHIASFLFAILNLYFGIALLRINYRKSWNRLTGWMFILNSMSIIAMAMLSMAVDIDHKYYWLFIFRSMNSPIPFIMLYFALVFPQPRFSRRTNRKIQLFLIAFVGVFALLFLFNKNLFWVIDLSHVLDRYPTIFYFLYVNYPHTIAILICGYVWFRQYLKEGDNRIKKQLSLLLVGFLFSPITEVVSWSGRSAFSFGSIHNVIYIIVLFIVIVPIAIYVIFQSARQMIRREEFDKVLFWGIVLAILYGFVVIFRHRVFGHVELGISLTMLGFALIRPICFTVAVLKYQLFDIDIIVKRSTYIFIIVSVIALVFSGIQEGIELILPFSKIISALIVAAAFIPIEKLSGKITNTLFPWNESSDEYLRERRKDIYLAALEGAYYDAILTPDEERMLTSLRNQLKITDEEHIRYAHEAQKSVLPGALGTGEKRDKVGKRKILYYAISISVLFILFVVGQELLENVLPMPTLVSAVLLSMLFIPIRFVLDKYIIKRFRGTAEKTDPREQALAVYEGILRDAWEDRVITDMESDMLLFIRKELGIREGEHREMARRIFV